MKRIPPPIAVDSPHACPFLPEPGTLLPTVLGETSVAEFLATSYLRTPVVRRGTAEALRALVSDDLMRRLLQDPRSDIVWARAGQIMTPTTPAGSERRTDDRCSVILRHVERQDPSIARYAAAVAAVLPGPIDAHIYRTPAGTYGFGWHCDPEEVFIIQTDGSKRYLVRENTAFPAPFAPSMPTAADFAREPSPVQEFTLMAGDWLYIPGGWWHVACAIEDSTSLSLGIQAMAVSDLLQVMGRSLTREAEFRQRLPPCSDERDTASLAAYREALRVLSRAIAAAAEADPAILHALVRMPTSAAAPLRGGTLDLRAVLRGQA